MKKIIGKLFLRKSLIIKRINIINGWETAVSEQEKHWVVTWGGRCSQCVLTVAVRCWGDRRGVEVG